VATPQDSTDAELIGRIARGDRLAMHALFGRHQARVYRFSLRLVENQMTAEDIASDVFIDVWRHAAGFEARSSVSTWLLAIARNKAYSAMRRRKEAALDEEAAEAIEDPADDPEIARQKQDKGELMRACLARLSAEHREVIDLVYYHEKSVAEVAEITGAPQATVKTRMFYARKRLSELFAAAGIDRGWP
jgi:RNA polymerase sigma-70 factor (ECF subfamily)